jgi:hypothetical protein
MLQDTCLVEVSLKASVSNRTSALWLASVVSNGLQSTHAEPLINKVVPWSAHSPAMPTNESTR